MKAKQANKIAKKVIESSIEFKKFIKYCDDCIKYASSKGWLSCVINLTQLGITEELFAVSAIKLKKEGHKLSRSIDGGSEFLTISWS